MTSSSWDDELILTVKTQSYQRFIYVFRDSQEEAAFIRKMGVNHPKDLLGRKVTVSRNVNDNDMYSSIKSVQA